MHGAADSQEICAHAWMTLVRGGRGAGGALAETPVPAPQTVRNQTAELLIVSKLLDGERH